MGYLMTLGALIVVPLLAGLPAWEERRAVRAAGTSNLAERGAVPVAAPEPARVHGGARVRGPRTAFGRRRAVPVRS